MTMPNNGSAATGPRLDTPTTSHLRTAYALVEQHAPDGRDKVDILRRLGLLVAQSRHVRGCRGTPAPGLDCPACRGSWPWPHAPRDHGRAR